MGHFVRTLLMEIFPNPDAQSSVDRDVVALAGMIENVATQFRKRNLEGRIQFAIHGEMNGGGPIGPALRQSGVESLREWLQCALEGLAAHVAANGS